jgi:hypothetical protein
MTNSLLKNNKVFGIDMSSLVEQFWSFRRRVSKRVLLLEFGSSSLTYAECRVGLSEIQLEHLGRVELPDSAVDRGAPTDPAQMAALIKTICKAEKIPAHRVAVVLPSDTAYTKIVDIPSSLDTDGAREFANNPSSGLQIPIPLQQTDFDLMPVTIKSKVPQAGEFTSYFLTSVPQKIVDQVLDCLQQAGLELCSLDLGFTSQLRLIAGQVMGLSSSQYLLLLELMPDATHLCFVSQSGPVRCQRIAALREFPEPKLQDIDPIILDDALSAEAITISDESYLPISQLDVRVLVAEIAKARKEFEADFPGLKCLGIELCSINSAHPGIVDLLSAAIKLPVKLARPSAATGVGKLSFSKLMVHQGLGRLVGLGLGLLPTGSLNACSLSPLAEHESMPDSFSDSPLEDERDEQKITNEMSDSSDNHLCLEEEADWPSVNGSGEESVAYEQKPEQLENVENHEEPCEILEEGSNLDHGMTDLLVSIIPEEDDQPTDEENEWPSILPFLSAKASSAPQTHGADEAVKVHEVTSTKAPDEDVLSLVLVDSVDELINQADSHDGEDRYSDSSSDTEASSYFGLGLGLVAEGEQMEDPVSSDSDDEQEEEEPWPSLGLEASNIKNQD